MQRFGNKKQIESEHFVFAIVRDDPNDWYAEITEKDSMGLVAKVTDSEKDSSALVTFVRPLEMMKSMDEVEEVFQLLMS